MTIVNKGRRQDSLFISIDADKDIRVDYSAECGDRQTVFLKQDEAILLIDALQQSVDELMKHDELK